MQLAVAPVHVIAVCGLCGEEISDFLTNGPHQTAIEHKADCESFSLYSSYYCVIVALSVGA